MTAKAYFEVLHQLLELVERTQMEQITAAAHMFAACVAGRGMIHTFGSGHSHIIAEESFHRAGGLAAINPMLDPNLTSFGTLSASLLERVEGYGKVLVSSFDVRSGEVVVVVSNSGINAVPIEVAVESRNIGAKVVALTSVKEYAGIPSRHSSGKKLAEVADIVVDSCVPRGDAAVSVDGIRAGPTSTAVCSAIFNSIIVETARVLNDTDSRPPILLSGNLSDASTVNSELMNEFVPRVRVLRRK
jgi:uncharacterized phosphosugar-binding protein